MQLSAAQILPHIARYLHWIISGTHNRFKYLTDVNLMATPRLKNMMLIENTQLMNNPNQISKSKLILSNNTSDMQRLERDRTRV